MFRMLLLLAVSPLFVLAVEDEKPVFPLWDNVESVAEYAKRVNLPPTQTIELSKGVKLDLVLIPAGKFLMGSPPKEEHRTNDELQHEVTLTEPCYMGKYEVTQAQWESVIGKNPSQTVGNDRPVDHVSWDDTQEFFKKAGHGLQLPTEAQWEYACRAGTKTSYFTGETEEGLLRVAWFAQSNKQPSQHAVGLKQPNTFGLYDMHGNESEWVADFFAQYPADPVKDPTGPASNSGGNRVIRGGNWKYGYPGCRSAARWHNAPNLDMSGFRVVMPVSRVKR